MALACQESPSTHGKMDVKMALIGWSKDISIDSTTIYTSVLVFFICLTGFSDLVVKKKDV